MALSITRIGCKICSFLLPEVVFDKPTESSRSSNYEPDLDRWDRSLCVKYLQNEHPDGLLENPYQTMATVGWGNMSLPSAEGLWQYEELSPMKTTNSLGIEVDIPNPFDVQTVSSPLGATGGYEPTRLESYQIMAHQLLDPKMNIEYIAAHLEESALRRTAIDEAPSAFMAAAWHTAGMLTKDVIWNLKWDWGNAKYAVYDVSKVLEIWGETSSYQVNSYTEPDLYWLELQKALRDAALP